MLVAGLADHLLGVSGSALALAGAWLAIARPLRQLPFAQPDQLVAIETLKTGEAGGSTWADLVDLRMGSVQSIAGFSPRTWGLQTAPHGHIEVVLSQQVTGTASNQQSATARTPVCTAIRANALA